MKGLPEPSSTPQVSVLAPTCWVPSGKSTRLQVFLCHLGLPWWGPWAWSEESAAQRAWLTLSDVTDTAALGTCHRRKPGVPDTLLRLLLGAWPALLQTLFHAVLFMWLPSGPYCWVGDLEVQPWQTLVKVIWKAQFAWLCREHKTALAHSPDTLKENPKPPNMPQGDQD